MNEYCYSYKECYDIYSLSLWRIISMNKIKSLYILSFDYYYYILTGLLVFYNQKILSNHNSENTFLIVKILTNTVLFSYYLLPIISALNLFINNRIFDVVMVRTVLFAQVITFPLYYLAYTNKFQLKKKHREYPYNIFIVLMIILIYSIIFLVYLFTVSEYATIK